MTTPLPHSSPAVPAPVGPSAGIPVLPSRRSILLGAGLGTAGLLGTAPGALADGRPSDRRRPSRPLRLDFGPGRVATGHHRVRASSLYSPDAGFGFVSTSGLTETDRGGKDPVRSDFVTARDATFRVDLSPGDYAITVVAGDLEGDTFPRSYVERIRNKSAGYRTRATEAEARAGDLERALFTERVRALDLLADPGDLEFRADLLDDAAALEQAARDLLARKPHYGRRATVAGSGVRDTPDGEEFGLLDIMRAG